MSVALDHIVLSCTSSSIILCIPFLENSEGFDFVGVEFLQEVIEDCEAVFCPVDVIINSRRSVLVAGDYQNVKFLFVHILPPDFDIVASVLLEEFFKIFLAPNFKVQFKRLVELDNAVLLFIFVVCLADYADSAHIILSLVRPLPAVRYP